MMDEELVQLKFSDIEGKDEKLVEGIGERLRGLAKKQNAAFDQTILSGDQVHEFLLINVYRLKADTLNKLAKTFPAIAYSLISTSEISKLDVTLLSEAQIDALFAVEENVHQLSKTQIDHCLGKVETKFLKHLNEKQISELDYSKVDKEAFELLFNTYDADKTEKRLQRLSDAQIDQARGHFKFLHWNKLSDAQISNLDYSKVDKEAFEAIFHTYESTKMEKRVQLLSNTQIEQTRAHFKFQHWNTLSDAQIRKLDFSKIDKEAFDAIFHTYDTDKTEKRVQLLSDQQLIAGKTLFLKNLERYLTPHQKQLLQ